MSKFKKGTIEAPQMARVREAADATGLSYKYLLTLCKENKIANIHIGRDYRINMNALCAMLNGLDNKGGE